MTDYVNVCDELETIEKLQQGFSIARYGDGELKMIHGSSYRRQSISPKLSAELYWTCVRPHKRCIVGIATMDPRGPKILNWLRHRNRFMKVLNPDMQYYSAFITRPDSAPWIENEGFVAEVQKLWAGKRAVVLCQRKGSMFRAVRPAARQCIHVECPTHQAYDIIDKLESRILTHEPEIVVLSCGPTATCLANRLAKRGLQAVDLGSAGGFFCRYIL